MFIIADEDPSTIAQIHTKKKKGRPMGKKNMKTLLAMKMAEESNSGKFITILWIPYQYINHVLILMVFRVWK